MALRARKCLREGTDPPASTVPPTLARLADNKARAEHAWQDAYNAHVASLPLLDDDGFWTCVDTLRDCIEERGVGERGSVEHGADEFMRRASCGGTLDEALRFAKTYRVWKSRLAKALRDVVKGGDDGFGDLCDALPVAGMRKVCEVAVAGDYASERSLFAAVRVANLGLNHAKDEKAWPEFAKGEWYVEMMLDDKASYFYAHYALRNGGPELPGAKERGWPDAPKGTAEAVEAALDALRADIEAVLPAHASKAALALREFRCYVRTMALRAVEARKAAADAAYTAAGAETKAADRAVYAARCDLEAEVRRA